MLASKYRLHVAADILAVFKRGRKIDNKFFAVWLYAHGRPSRATVIVSKKIDKRATARNLLKRRVREALRTVLPRLSPTADIVVRPLIESKRLSASEIKNIIHDLFSLS